MNYLFKSRQIASGILIGVKDSLVSEFKEMSNHDLAEAARVTVSDSTTYLGVVLDNKLTLKQHADKICAKVSPKTSVLKRLAGVKWGGTLDLLNKTYKIYIKPNIMYSGEALATAHSIVCLLYTSRCV